MQTVRFQLHGEQIGKGYAYRYEGFEIQFEIVMNRDKVLREYDGVPPKYLDVQMTYVMDDKGKVVAD